MSNYTALYGTTTAGGYNPYIEESYYPMSGSVDAGPSFSSSNSYWQEDNTYTFYTPPEASLRDVSYGYQSTDELGLSYYGNNHHTQYSALGVLHYGTSMSLVNSPYSYIPTHNESINFNTSYLADSYQPIGSYDHSSSYYNDNNWAAMSSDGYDYITNATNQDSMYL